MSGDRTILKSARFVLYTLAVPVFRGLLILGSRVFLRSKSYGVGHCIFYGPLTFLGTCSRAMDLLRTLDADMHRALTSTKRVCFYDPGGQCPSAKGLCSIPREFLAWEEHGVISLLVYSYIIDMEFFRPEMGGCRGEEWRPAVVAAYSRVHAWLAKHDFLPKVRAWDYTAQSIITSISPDFSYVGIGTNQYLEFMPVSAITQGTRNALVEWRVFVGANAGSLEQVVASSIGYPATTLKIQSVDPGTVSVDWNPPGGTVEAAHTPSGPWTSVSDTGPASIPTAAEQSTFFRVRKTFNAQADEQTEGTKFCHRSAWTASFLEQPLMGSFFSRAES